MVAMNGRHSILIFAEVGTYKLGDFKKKRETGTHVIFPVKTVHIVQFTLVYFPGAHIYHHVVVPVSLLEELSHLVNGVPVNFLQTWSRESHGNNAWSDIGEIQVEVSIFEPILRPWDYFSDEVHFSVTIINNYFSSKTFSLISFFLFDYTWLILIGSNSFRNGIVE